MIVNIIVRKHDAHRYVFIYTDEQMQELAFQLWVLALREELNFDLEDASHCLQLAWGLHENNSKHE